MNHIQRIGLLAFLGLLIFSGSGAPLAAAEWIDLTDAVVVVRDGDLPQAEQTAATVLIEEIEKRTGIKLPQTDQWLADKTVIALTSQNKVPGWNTAIPMRKGENLPEAQPEGYRLSVQQNDDAAPIVWIQGADPRGVLYGAGALLRNLQWGQETAKLPADLDMATAPVSPIRGHQLGYRATANSWDAWTEEQFDQYIRELALFGTNAIENIPFQDGRKNSMMKYSRQDMNRKLSEICNRYGLDYWVWTPADFDLNNKKLRSEMLDKHETLYRDCQRLDGVFFPAGDPGDNPPELVLPFLEELSERLIAIHPKTRIWLSLQRLSRRDVEYIFDYIKTKNPKWLGGLVAGPSSPPAPLIRNSLPAQFQFRLYPDITHNKLCQYVVPWWDPAYALTLGREAINPRPREYAEIHNRLAPYTDGFISYSDGVHDDVNKIVWSMLGWDPNRDVREILIEYCRVFFDPAIAPAAADGILALEKNWQGALADNGAVEGTLLYWNELEKQAPHLSGNWRWQMNLLRANYDAYTRRRLIYETKLENQANEILAQAPQIGSKAAMKQALDVLNRAQTDPISPKLHSRIEELCQDLFESISLQTSVEKYNASGAERGAFLDFVDHPLNNRWWLEDRFTEIAKLPGEAERLKELEIIRTWENPGAGSFYDDLGNIAKSPRLIRWNPAGTNPAHVIRSPSTTYWWLDNGKTRARPSWLTTMEAGTKVVYEGLDPNANYVIRVAGYGQSLLRADDQRLQTSLDERGLGEFKEFPVPKDLLKDRKLTITWDAPTGEEHLNWRQQSRNAEIWLLKQP
ncbi:hypothetical protein Mal52_04830 [Symmachiella dynata]|uniref:Beta-hexosaminidase bacterial type N-terminal domain-containing protein n=1 Tax=Symmachiella dynata TaxID=2527995 RepID=A0A517ZHS1_9PLAN|nr:glycoside hydrolase family 20 zincin-like fold domain-containing protein [Symmachiella dynata]QDU42028.1 hypothetical protein Mal52_04830 [Symmachiella dynata]